MTAKNGSTIVLIDGEHYPPVIARAISALEQRGDNPVLALLVGGKEKLGQQPLEVGIELASPNDIESGLAEAIERTGASRVFDLSDEPVLDYVRRCRLASIALWKGATYSGPDFEFRPPTRSARPALPSISIIGTGKRSGKTALAGAIARSLKDSGKHPVVVAMGRGGPKEPEVIDQSEALSPQVFARWADQGRHAASDYIEDALTARVPTVGSWRAGGGMAGASGFGNYEAALSRAESLGGDILLLEGSGAAIPPAQWDAAVLVVNGRIDPGHLCGYFGLFRVLLADLVVLTMIESTVDRSRLAAVEDCILSRPLTKPKITHTVLRPHPLGDISNKKIWIATTAGEEAGNILVNHLEEAYGARVVGISHALADRRALADSLASIPSTDAIVVELKAAAVDVVTRFGLERETEVVYLDNRPEWVGGEGPLDEVFSQMSVLAEERFSS